MSKRATLKELIEIFLGQGTAERMATAQKRAALPVSEGGLGLPSTNTPGDRAALMYPATTFRGMKSIDDAEYPSLVTAHPNPKDENTMVFHTPHRYLANTYNNNVEQLRFDPRGHLEADYDGRFYTGTRFNPDELDEIPEPIFDEMESRDMAIGDFASDALDVRSPYPNDAAVEVPLGTTDRLAAYAANPSESYSGPISGVRMDNVVDVGASRSKAGTRALEAEVMARGLPVTEENKTAVRWSPATVYASKGNTLRSQDAAYDPFLKEWHNLKAGLVGPAVATGGLLSTTNDAEAQTDGFDFKAASKQAKEMNDYRAMVAELGRAAEGEQLLAAMLKNSDSLSPEMKKRLKDIGPKMSPQASKLDYAKGFGREYAKTLKDLATDPITWLDIATGLHPAKWLVKGAVAANSGLATHELMGLLDDRRDGLF